MARYTICERGILVDSGDTEGFVQGLTRLLEDEGLRQALGKQGRECVAARYSKERLVSDILALYESLSR